MFTPTRLQRLEGLVILSLAVYAFTTTDVSWWWFAIFLLVPDVSMIGYMRNPILGATIYNIGHSLVIPGLLFLWYWLVDGPTIMFVVAAIWMAHIGMDRLFGYGLKFRDDFKHTHLGWIGER